MAAWVNHPVAVRVIDELDGHELVAWEPNHGAATERGLPDGPEHLVPKAV